MPKEIVNPRLTDHLGNPFSQDDVSFAIPHLKEDINLYIDPFLLWCSENSTYKELHEHILEFFEHVREKITSNDLIAAERLLLNLNEIEALGLGYSQGNKRGSTIGPALIKQIIQTYQVIPQLQTSNFNHIEVIQLLIPKIAEDRISDIASHLIIEYLIEYTEQQAKELSLPTKPALLGTKYDSKRRTWVPLPKAILPYNLVDESPLLLTPLEFLRHLPFINYEDYYRSYYVRHILPANKQKQKQAKEDTLLYNQANYNLVQDYIKAKEDNWRECKPTPLFEPLQIATLKKKYKDLRALATGQEEGKAKTYEELIYDLLSSLLYPELEYAQTQARTINGIHYRDLIFYNDRKTEFLKDLYERYEARQPVFELKNVAKLDREHVNQLYRYLDKEFGRFGILVTRNPPPKNIIQNTIDLHSSKRFIILVLDDTDIELMINALDSRRRPIEVIKKKYIEFTRLLPK